MKPNNRLRPIWLTILKTLACGWLASCRPENSAAISLSEIACRPEARRAAPAFVVAQTHTAVPEDRFWADQVVDYYGVELVENRLTYAAAFCDLFVLAEETAAVEMLGRTCTVPMDEAEPPAVGEDVCARESTGFRLVNFRQGRVVVSILADSHGFGVDKWAAAVNGRLTQR